MTWWTEFKGQLADSLRVDQDLLHILFGLILFCGFVACLRRRSHARILAFSGLVLVQLFNEVLDGLQWRIWTGEINWRESALDTALTIALPLAVLTSLSVLRLVQFWRSNPAAENEMISK